jgi:hypothetical protein
MTAEILLTAERTFELLESAEEMQFSASSACSAVQSDPWRA